MEQADIVIAGGGPVGVTLAHALAPLAAMGAKGRSVLHIVDAQDAQARDERPISLSWGSRLLLERLGLWEALPATPIERIHVSQQKHFGRTLISAADHGVAALGYVVSFADLCSKLPEAAAIPRLQGRLAAYDKRDQRMLCEVTPAAGESGAATQVSARLLVLADGGAQGHDHIKDYGQSAVVCTLRADRREAGTAWERFTPEGPLALLPFRDQLALVWSSRRDHAQDVLGLDDQAFLARLQQAFGQRVGAFSHPGPRRVFPLSLRWRNRVAEAGLVAIGNAAQSLHPVAGQGLNLGLRDAWELAELLLGGEMEPDSARLAERYAARRRLDRMTMTRITDGMIAAFGLDWPLAAAARGTALALLDAFAPARRLLSRRMMFGARGFP
ncbi:MAG TPA: FAD-dependent monooxygenase [Burkholderiales bacterium]|nr:FAD-dependent monooxygenase [Burkholderiales bacterium]